MTCVRWTVPGADFVQQIKDGFTPPFRQFASTNDRGQERYSRNRYPVACWRSEPLALPMQEHSRVMSHRRSIAIVCIALLSLGAADAWAQQGRGRAAPPPRQAQASDHTLSDSVRRVERDTRGEVLSAERVPFDGREMHRVKVLDDRGRVRVYMDDPRDHAERDRSQERGRDRDPRRPPPRRDDD